MNLEYCPNCLQMTNHKDNKCLKCNMNYIKQSLEEFDEEFPDSSGLFEAGDPFGSRREAVKSFLQSKLERLVDEIEWKMINIYNSYSVKHDFFDNTCFCCVYDEVKEDIKQLLKQYKH